MNQDYDIMVFKNIIFEYCQLQRLRALDGVIYYPESAS